MKETVLKEMIDNELEDLLHEEKINLMKMKMSHAVSPLENPQQIKFTRRTTSNMLISPS